MTSAAWRVSSGSTFRWRQWDDEFVLYHDESGDTHRLNALSARALEHLGRRHLAIRRAHRGLQRSSRSTPTPPSPRASSNSSPACTSWASSSVWMTLAKLSRSDLANRLREPGVLLRCGPLVMRLGTSLTELVDPLALLYADFPIEDRRRDPRLRSTGGPRLTSGRPRALAARGRSSTAAAPSIRSGAGTRFRCSNGPSTGAPSRGPIATSSCTRPSSSAAAVDCCSQASRAPARARSPRACSSRVAALLGRGRRHTARHADAAAYAAADRPQRRLD